MKTTSREAVSDFIGQHTLALVGATHAERPMGSFAFKALRKKGYTVYLVHPSNETIDDERCYSDLSSLPTPADGVIIFSKPEASVAVVQDALDAGIKRIWIQQGSDSPAALKLCADHGVPVVYNECILMFAEPVGFPHNMHRCVSRWMGKMPVS